MDDIKKKKKNIFPTSKIIIINTRSRRMPGILVVLISAEQIITVLVFQLFHCTFLVTKIPSESQPASPCHCTFTLIISVFPSVSPPVISVYPAACVSPAPSPGHSLFLLSRRTPQCKHSAAVLSK